jgi:DNA-binding CsgD family transcriptional regulator/tetratricopeptide (TPR) repeat protein
MGAVEAAARSAQDPLFVGRDGELSRLHDALRRAEAGQPVMLLVAGEAGVGKSRLVGRFAEQAGRAGTLVVLGGAAPLTGGALPYAPLLQALRAMTADHAQGASGELAGVLAELTGDRPAEERAWGPEIGRGRLFERLCGVLGGLGRAGPVLLVLEDLHWTDSATLDVLAFVMRTLRGAQLLVVGTYRSDDPGELLAGWLAEMRRSPQVGWLGLPRFTRAELTAQLVGLRGGPVDSRVVAEVFERSQGNPFFAEQLFISSVGAGRLPGVLREVLLAQVHQLSPAGQHLLRVAAVAGRSVHHDWLAAVADKPDDELTSALREAIDRGLLQVSPIESFEQDLYEFRHALLQEAVYGELLPGQRARLHAAYASALASASQSYSSARPSSQGEKQSAAPQFAAELAEHWYRARQPAEALAWSVQACDRAECVYAHAEAARHCERVLELWDQVPDAAGQVGADRADLHTRAARDWEYAGRDAEAMRHIEEALRQVDPEADPVRAGLLHSLRGWYLPGTADPEAALAASQEAVRLVPAEPPSAERAQVLLGYGRALLIRVGRYDEAAEIYEQALAAGRRAGSEPDVARAMAAVGYLRVLAGQVDAGIALLREANELTERSVGYAWGLSMAQTPPPALVLSDALLKTNWLEEASEVAIRGWERMRHFGLADHRSAFVLIGNAVEALLRLGRWDEAARLGEPVAEQPVSSANVSLQGVLAEMEGARGQFEAALARLERARDQGWRLGPERARELGQSWAEVHLWLGDPQPALTEVMYSLDIVTGTGQERFAGWLLCLGARALADLADQARALQDPAADVQRQARLLAGRVTEMTNGPFKADTSMPATATAEHALWDAEYTRLAGTPNPAAWQNVADAWLRLGHGYRAAYAQWRRAEALLDRGAGPAKASGPLREAHLTAVRLGAAPLRAQVEALARRARISLAFAEPEPVPVPVHPHGLTDREADVLRLLAKGHTNREIGQQLFISPKTASVHVTNILRKLAVRDRVQAATVAVHLGLADPPMPAGGAQPPSRSP